MARRSPKQRRLQREKLQGTGVILLSFAVLALMGWFLWEALINTIELDPDTLCPKEEGPTNYWAVVIDGTDPYNRIQWENIQNHFEEIKSEVPQHSMLAIFSVPERPQEALQPEVALCNPGSGEDLDVWTGNPELARKRWEEEFNAPLELLLDTLNTAGSLRRSPIMETIQAVKAQSGQYDVEDRRMFIVSDMMQHTDDYSHYGSAPPSFETFRSHPLYRRLRTDLSGWEIKVFYAWRDDSRAQQVQGRTHIDFWNEYFSAMGGILSRAKTIDG